MRYAQQAYRVQRQESEEIMNQELGLKDFDWKIPPEEMGYVCSCRLMLHIALVLYIVI